MTFLQFPQILIYSCRFLLFYIFSRFIFDKIDLHTYNIQHEQISDRNISLITPILVAFFIVTLNYYLNYDRLHRQAKLYIVCSFSVVNRQHNPVIMGQHPANLVRDIFTNFTLLFSEFNRFVENGNISCCCPESFKKLQFLRHNFNTHQIIQQGPSIFGNDFRVSLFSSIPGFLCHKNGMLGPEHHDCEA